MQHARTQRLAMAVAAHSYRCLFGRFDHTNMHANLFCKTTTKPQTKKPHRFHRAALVLVASLFCSLASRVPSATPTSRLGVNPDGRDQG